MLKTYLLLPIILFLGLFFSSCNSDTTNPVTAPTTGSIYVTSTPIGAQIWVDGTNSNKLTPDSVTGISAGAHTLVLVLANYLNDSSSVTVTAGLETAVPLRTLLSDKSITSYGPVQIWESADPSATDPSGIVLKSGQAVSIGTSTFGPVDIYYSSNGYVVATAYSLHNNTGRSTSFYVPVGTATNLFDVVASPLATTGWATQVNDTQTNYFFLFDQDSHYSKMIITAGGGGQPGVPAWIKVQWLYNNKPNDTRF